MPSPLAVRSLDFGDHFEDFLVSAVASILAIRLFLHLAGYPTVGGESLHVAHMLWGGLFMATALLLLLGWLGRSVKSLAAVLGGIGFGTFIDELGKFLTRDNDYFFELTFALIYVVLILMWIVVRTVRRRPLTRREALANAVELTLEGAWALAAALGAALLGGFAIRGELPALGPYGWAELVFSVVPALMVVAGILRMPSDRLVAYRWFKQAVLVLLLVTQFFAFYRDQLSAVYGLFSNLVVLITLNYMIGEERGRAGMGGPGGSVPG